jgi:hypothetical protein
VGIKSKDLRVTIALHLFCKNLLPKTTYGKPLHALTGVKWEAISVFTQATNDLNDRPSGEGTQELFRNFLGQRRVCALPQIIAYREMLAGCPLSVEIKEWFND